MNLNPSFGSSFLDALFSERITTMLTKNNILFFSENEMQKAAECVASFQVLNTTDPNMINNKNYYLAEVLRLESVPHMNFKLGIENNVAGMS